MTNPCATPAIRVLVFDSGVGGLSVLREITQLNPSLEIIYASDNAAFPYGTKTEAELLPRVSTVIGHLIDNFNPNLIVIACNTASTLALEHLRQQFSTPFVGVVPAIKPAASASHSKVIGLLATPATVKRPYTQALINEHAKGYEIIKVGSSWLVELAEMKLRGEAIPADALDSILAPFKMAGDLDQLVLACTHFPLLKNEIAQILPNVALVDSGEAIARRVASLLGTSAITPLATGCAVFTKDTPEAHALTQGLNQFGLNRIQFMEV